MSETFSKRCVVALGSTSALKIKAVITGFRHFNYEVVVLPQTVESGVADQPEGFDEMLSGARARANTALQLAIRADFGLGLESGIVEIQDLFFDPAIAVIIARDGRESVGFGPGFPIPKWAAHEARQSELGTVVMKRGAPDKNPMAYFSCGSIDRTELLSWAVRCAVVPHLFDHRFAPH